MSNQAEPQSSQPADMFVVTEASPAQSTLTAAARWMLTDALGRVVYLDEPLPRGRTLMRTLPLAMPRPADGEHPCAVFVVFDPAQVAVRQ